MNTSCVRGWSAVIISAGMILGMPAAGVTQQHIAASPEAPSSRMAGEPFGRLVTISFAAVSLKKAIDDVGAKAGIRVQYQAELLEAVKVPVSLHASAMPLRDVFAHVLSGTGLIAVAPVPSVVTILPGGYELTAQGVIAGRIVHARTKQPVAGAVIEIDGIRSTATTDREGLFRIPVGAGRYVIHIRAIGLVRRTQSVVVAEGGTVSVDIALEPSASVLDEVVVTGTVVATERKAIANPITVITAEEIEKRGITRVEEFLRGEVPGVVALDFGTAAYTSDSLGGIARANVYSRGSASLDGYPNPLKVYVDGVEMLDPTYLGTLDMQSVERIEIITGPQAATVYGSGAMGGVMQIFTKKGNARSAPEFTATIKYGLLEQNLSSGKTPSHHDALTVNGGLGASFSYSSNLSYQYTGQWQPYLFSRTIGVSSGVTYVQGALRLSASFAQSNGANGTQRGGGRILHTVLATDGTLGLNARTLRPSQKRSTSSAMTLALNGDYRIGANWQHHVSAGKALNTFDMAPLAPEFYNSGDTLYNRQSSSGGRTSMSYNSTYLFRSGAPLEAVFTLGGSASRASQTAVSGCTPGRMLTAYVACDRMTLSVNQTIDDRNQGGFGSLRIGILQSLFLTVGLRAEQNKHYGDQHTIDWTPTNGVAYTLELGSVALKVMGSYGRATKPPSSVMTLSRMVTNPGYEPSTWHAQIGNAELRPEVSKGPQGGVEVYIGQRASFMINHYQQKVTDLLMVTKVDSTAIVFLQDNSQFFSAITQWNNVASIRQYGWNGTGMVMLGPLQVNGTMSWSESRIIKTNEGPKYSHWGAEVGSLTQIPERTGNIKLSYAHNSTSITITSDLIGSSIKRGERIPQSWEEQSYMHLNGSYLRLREYDARKRDFPLTYQQRVPGYVRSHLAAQHRVTPWATFTMNITNLTNEFRNDGEFWNPTLGRQTLLGVTLRWP